MRIRRSPAAVTPPSNEGTYRRNATVRKDGKAAKKGGARIPACANIPVEGVFFLSKASAGTSTGVFFMARIACVLLLLLFPSVLRAEHVNRYISLAPATTEILFALGLGRSVVGVSSNCDYPPEASAKERIGSFSQPNIEKIIALKPDIVFGTGLEQNPVVHKLKALGVRVVVSDPGSFEELIVSIEEIGALTGRRDEAAQLIASMRKSIDAVSSRVSRIPENKRVRVFIELWHEPLMTAGKGSIVDDSLSLAGGVNIALDTARPYSMFSPEAVIDRNPDCILFTYMDSSSPEARMLRRAGWNSIAAVRAGRFINDIDPDLLLRPGPRLAEGIRILNERLYPDE